MVASSESSSEDDDAYLADLDLDKLAHEALQEIVKELAQREPTEIERLHILEGFKSACKNQNYKEETRKE